MKPSATVSPVQKLPASPRISALLACHNRREQTLRCLEALDTAAAAAAVTIDAVLVDDGSSDGTAEAVSQRYRWVRIIRADGSLFWNRGMHRAQAEAMQHDTDYLLWLNDDTELLDDALQRLLETARQVLAESGRRCIVVGSTADRQSGALSYGGHIAPHPFRPFTYERVWHATAPVECHAMNGNAVLIPIDVARQLGNLDPAYVHAMGDYDYALRARAAGFRIFVAPGFVGYCTQGSTRDTYLDTTLPLRARWARIMAPTGLPPRSWMRFTRRHGGPGWPLYFIWPYVRLLVGSALRRRVTR